MKNSMKQLCTLAPVFLMLSAGLSLVAQEQPLTIGDFDNSGSVTTGYRLTSFSGYRPMYQNLFDLNSGFRVLDFSLFGEARKDTRPFADDYSLVVSGLGGEPFSTAQLSVRKKNVYDLRVNYRQTYYYIDPNAGAAVPSGVPGLLSNHNWATVRKMGSVNLLVHATNNLKFRFEYSRNTRDGAEDTSRVMDYFGVPSSFGSFQRANPYYLIGVVNEQSDRIAGGIDYTLRDWTFHYNIGMQRFTDSFDGNNPYANERSFDIGDATTAKELLTATYWADYHKLTTPMSELSWNGKLSPRLETHGNYTFFDYSGPASLLMTGSGLARGTTTSNINPYSFSNTSIANLREPSQIVGEGFSYDANNWLSVDADYRYSRQDTTANATFSSTSNCCATNVTANGTTLTGTQLNQWRIGASNANLDVVLTPMPSLMIHLGIGYLKNDVEFLSNGATDPLSTLRTKTVLPTFSVRYQPNKVFSVRVNTNEINNGSSFTRETPHTEIGSRIVTRIRPAEKFWIENTTSVRDAKLLTYSYVSRSTQSASTLTYEFSDRASGFAAFSYSNFYSQSFVNFLRGTAPITNVSLTDQNVERLWQAGFNVTPMPRVTLSFAGNYVRVNGLGVVLGELPLYGPITFPYASASLSFDAHKAGKLALQLQRTYYEEQIVPGNNFGADILLIKWTRNF